MPRNRVRDRRPQKRDGDVDRWIPVAIMLVVFPPVGVIMLLKRFQSLTSEESSERRAKSSSSAGWVLTMLGFLMLVMGIRSFFPAMLAVAVGLGLVGYSGFLGRSRRRFDKYLHVVGKRKVMRVRDIAAAIPVTEDQACRDLEQMIEDGRFPEGAYLDMSTRALVIDGSAAEQASAAEIKLSFEPEAAKTPKAESRPEPKPEPRKQEPKAPEDPYMAKLREIRRMDELIANEEVSQKIRRIEEVTRLIFDKVKQSPAKLDQIRTFMNYYLPTTLKLLSAYAELEKQTVEGDNIRSSREAIEKMLSQLVFGFEQQLDQMFEADALDISSDITVLERMMAKDGLSENPYQLPKCPPKAKKAGEITLTLGGGAAAQAPAGAAAQAAQEEEA